MKFLSWNVEHFKGKAARSKRVVGLIKDENPDIFGIIEVTGKTVFSQMVKEFPGYSFSITEGDQSQEILIGVRGGITAFMTQRNEFKRSNPHLRPGALLTVTGASGKPLPILFAHLKSLPSPEGFGLRDAMFDKVRNLKKALNKAAPGKKSELVLVGDLNTMGMNLTYSAKDVEGPEELARVEKVLKAADLKLKSKTAPATFNNGSGSSYPPADLDHVFATPGLKFRDQAGAEVKVGGWAEEPTVAKQDAWIRNYSDHAPLIFELDGV